MNVTIYQDSEWTVDIVPSSFTLNNTRFNRDEEVVGEIPGVLDKTQIVSIINLLDYSQSLGEFIIKNRIEHCFKTL